jgi:DNA-directed RNA polymerase specialized sigma24 family protein
MDLRIKHKRAYARWSDDEEEFLVFLYDWKEYEYKLIANILQRQVSAIKSRLSDLGFIEDNYDDWN